MDSNNKIVNQNTPPVAQNDQMQTQPTVAPVQPVAPVGSVNKETGPIDVGKTKINELSPSSPEVSHEISQELKDIGVEENKDRPDLTFEHKEMGIEHAGPYVPVSTSPSNLIQYPMSEEEIADKLKTGQNDDSGKWLAGLVHKIMKVMGF